MDLDHSFLKRILYFLTSGPKNIGLPTFLGKKK